MENNKHAGPLKPVLSQTKNNTTLWIGHLQDDPIDHFAGQTFQCPAEGTLDNIQVYSSVVQRPGDIELTLHEFDMDSRKWKPALASSSIHVSQQDQTKWLSFPLPHSALAKGKTYGFRLHSTNAMIGIGEWVRANDEPCSFGQEWNANSNNTDGVFFTWFSLAFKVEMVA